MPEELQSESKFVEANGINHHYLEWGNPETPPIVMLHGVGLCAQVWNKLARGLAQDYHVLAFDLRGHGDTDKPGSGYTFLTLGEDVSAFIQTMGLERPFAVGHSAGGMSLLISDHLVPGIVGRTVLVDTRVGSAATTVLTSERRQERMRRTREKRPIWANRETMHEAYRERRVFKTWDDEVFNDYIEGGTRLLDDGRAELKCPTDVEATFYDARAALDPSQYVRGLTGQYRLLVGGYQGAQSEQDDAVQRLLGESTGSSFKQLDRGSHFVPMEYPDLVLSEIREYFE